MKIYNENTKLFCMVRCGAVRTLTYMINLNYNFRVFMSRRVRLRSIAYHGPKDTHSDREREREHAFEVDIILFFFSIIKLSTNYYYWH